MVLEYLSQVEGEVDGEVHDLVSRLHDTIIGVDSIKAIYYDDCTDDDCLTAGYPCSILK